MRGKYYNPTMLEHLACELLMRYQRISGKPLTPPICAEHILDTVLFRELRPVLWDVIPEPPGRTILAGLAPTDRQIVLNETRQQLITETAGLYNTLIAHEIAHWELHVDHALIGQPTLSGIESTLEFECERDASSSWDEKNAHRFMGYLLMPRDLLLSSAQAVDLSNWADLYDLREQFDVTITALKIRVQELGLVYIDRDGSFYGSRQEATGQQRLL